MVQQALTESDVTPFFNQIIECVGSNHLERMRTLIDENMPQALFVLNEWGWTVEHLNEMILTEIKDQPIKHRELMKGQRQFTLGSNKDKFGYPCNCKGVLIKGTAGDETWCARF